MLLNHVLILAWATVPRASAQALALDIARRSEPSGVDEVSQPVSIQYDDEGYEIVPETAWPTYEEAFSYDPQGILYEFDSLGECSAFHNATFCEAIALAHNTEMGEDVQAVNKRQGGLVWTTSGEFAMYIARYVDGPESNGNSRLKLRDMCNGNTCTANMVGWGVNDHTSPCDRMFRACRVPTPNPWRLRCRWTITDHPYSCGSVGQMASSLDVMHGKRYASLHDEANGRRVGWCFVHNTHRYDLFCTSGGPRNEVRSGVRCRFD